MWLLLLFVAVGIFQIWLGYVGIEHHFGTGWAIGAIVAAFGFRVMLPLTAGSYFGAVDVMGWEWYIGLVIAAPGLLFAAPYLVTAALEPLLKQSQKEQPSCESQPVPLNQNNEREAKSIKAEHAASPQLNKNIRNAPPDPIKSMAGESMPTKSQETGKKQLIAFHEKTSVNILEAVPEAALIIEYSEEAQNAWAAVSYLPEDYKKLFLQKLNCEPSSSPNHLLIDVYSEFVLSRPVVGSEEIIRAAIFARGISHDAEDEFQKVIKISNQKIPLVDVISKISAKFDATESSRVRAFDYFESLKPAAIILEKPIFESLQQQKKQSLEGERQVLEIETPHRLQPEPERIMRNEADKIAALNKAYLAKDGWAVIDALTALDFQVGKKVGGTQSITRPNGSVERVRNLLTFAHEIIKKSAEMDDLRRAYISKNIEATHYCLEVLGFEVIGVEDAMHFAGSLLVNDSN